MTQLVPRTKLWRAVAIVRALVFFVIVVAVASSVVMAATYFPSLAYGWVALFGGVVGASELIARYRDDPWRAVTRSAALFYIFINVIASAGAFRLIDIFKWLIRPDPGEQASVRVLVAGFSAMAFFRSSLFITRVGKQDVQIGPVSFLQIFLAAADRQVDRTLGQARSKEAEELMSAVNFAKAADVLPSYCMALMQNVPDAEQVQIGAEVARIGKREIDDRTKAMMLGLQLMTAFGKPVLEAAVDSLAAQIKDVARITINPFSDIQAGNAVQAKATAFDRADQEIRLRTFTWTSTTPAIATVDMNGLVTGVSAGSTTITVSADATSTTVPLKVT